MHATNTVHTFVSIHHVDEIAVVALDHPPVNALSADVRRELQEALLTLGTDSGTTGVIIICRGRTFVAGADIGEFGTPKQMQPPTLRDLCALIEGFRKPILAAVHGTALGGGCELALACHYRVATRDAKLGLPEVKLGLMPGAGGTVRLPRLVGPEVALQMIVSGAPVSARDALQDGLIDCISEENLQDDAVAFLKGKLGAEGAERRQVRNLDVKLSVTRANPARFEELAEGLLQKAGRLNAPRACVDAVRRSFSMPFEDALSMEREAFLKLLSDDQSKALRHAFFAEREAAKVPSLTIDTPRKTIARVGIIGAGTMGAGIAMAFANAGISVTLVDNSDEAIDRGRTAIDRNYSASISRGSLTLQEHKARVQRIAFSTDVSAVEECDLIIEAVFEDLSVKKEVFARLGRLARPGAILATNTSYLDVNDIAQASGRPQDVLGLHFFSPANVMKLLEIVRGTHTSPTALASALAVAKSIGKVPVVVGVCRGFVGNRMLAARSAENEQLLLEGASVQDVDQAFLDFGWPMGPFQMFDLAGLDIGWRNRKSMGTTAIIADALCERGRLGQKAGKGWYQYLEGSRTPQPDNEVAALIESTARNMGIARRRINADEIVERTHYPMVNEGARILEEGVATRSSDIDVIWIYGYGFPRAKGGPMYWAKNIENKQKIIDRLNHWKGVTGRSAFEPCSGLTDL